MILVRIIYTFDKKSIEKLRTISLKLPIQLKAEEKHFKMMNAIYASKELRIQFIIGNITCS